MSRFYVSVYSFITIFHTITANNCNSCAQNREPRRNAPDINPLTDNRVLLNNPVLYVTEPYIPPQRRRNRCCPYDFDSKFCRTVDDRLLCGFNKNVGQPKTKDTVVELHGGCRLRAGRLECGYVHAPFTNPRRPPVWDNEKSMSDYEDEQPLPDMSDDKTQHKEFMKNNNSVTTPSPIRAVTRCVEIGDRIVCRKL